MSVQVTQDTEFGPVVDLSPASLLRVRWNTYSDNPMTFSPGVTHAEPHPRSFAPSS
jgi:hypothetical protein